MLRIAKRHERIVTNRFHFHLSLAHRQEGLSVADLDMKLWFMRRPRRTIAGSGLASCASPWGLVGDVLAFDITAQACEARSGTATATCEKARSAHRIFDKRTQHAAASSADDVGI
jgi:hypothetical protein